MNVHDSEKLAGLLESKGWISADSIDVTDVVILNTCSVRQKAEQKVLSRLGRLRLMKLANPHLKFVLAGCMAKAWGNKLFGQVPYLDVVVGPGAFTRVPELLEEAFTTGNQLLDVSERDDVFTLPAGKIRNESQFHAWVTVMEGCNNFCAYCIVPYVRGRERSRPGNEIVAEVRTQVAQGIREITLLGQNVNSYRSERGDFPELLRDLDPIEGLERIRFTTSHPKDMSDALIHAVADLPKVCDYLHFPAQSGSSHILERMKRGYTRETYLERVNAIKQCIPDVALSTDIIIGYPGETDEDFQETLSLIREVEYENAFIFNYSIREGTEAADLVDDVPIRTKAARFQLLLREARGIIMRKNQCLIGESVEVLVEGAAKRGGGKLMGRTRHNRVVNFSGTAIQGTLTMVRVESASPNCLYGYQIA